MYGSAVRRRIILVRHTPVAIAAGTCYGRLDVPLSATATADIAATLAKLSTADRIYTSPAQRCLRLALAVSARDRAELQVDPRLQELDFGLWEGSRWDDIPRAELDRWSENLLDTAAGGGESMRSLWHRVADFITAASAGPGDSIAVVSHHGPLRALYAQLRGRGPDSLWEVTIPYGGILSVDLTSRTADTLTHH